MVGSGNFLPTTELLRTLMVGFQRRSMVGSLVIGQWLACWWLLILVIFIFHDSSTVRLPEVGVNDF
jgi:hypothetical protein